MKFKSVLVLGITFATLIFFSSCVKESDINLDTNKKQTSQLISNILLSSFDATSFVDAANQSERAIRIDTTNLEFSNSNFLMEQLTKANLNFRFKNSLEQDFEVDIQFLNELNDTKYTLHISIASGTLQRPSLVETNVAIESPELSAFMEATKLIYTVTLVPKEQAIVTESEGLLQLQSDATYSFDF